jgi:hypothetical protein
MNVHYEENSSELKNLFARTCDYSVTFLDARDSPICAFGSGTLVDYGQISGIVTCAHVLDTWAKFGEAGLATRSPNSNNRRPPIELRHDDFVIFGSGNSGGDGPDLAFLRLSESVRTLLKSKSTFLNGNKRAADAKDGEPTFNTRFDFVVGSVEEFNQKVSQPDGHHNFTNNILLNNGQVVNVCKREEFDYLAFKPGQPDLPLKLPTSYGGTSGGGLWSYYFHRTHDNRLTFLESRFLGVAFFQTGDASPNIICHGPKSIHQVLRTAILAKWPEAS